MIEKEKRLIDANDLKRRMLAFATAVKSDFLSIEAIIDRIDTNPTVDAVEVVHGEWVRLDAHKGIEQFKCSICRSECYVPTCMNEPMYEYCPNCGSKMDGERRTDA